MSQGPAKAQKDGALDYANAQTAAPDSAIRRAVTALFGCADGRPATRAVRTRMKDAVRVTAGDLAGVAVVLRALADTRWTVFEKLRLHATLRWPGLTPEVSLLLSTHHLDTASHVFVTLSVPQPDGTAVEWGLVVWIAPDVVSATGHVYAKDVRGVIVDHVFDCTEEASEAADAAENDQIDGVPSVGSWSLENAGVPGREAQNMNASRYGRARTDKPDLARRM